MSLTRRILILGLAVALAVAALILAPIEFAAAQRQPYYGPPPGACRGFFCSLFGPPVHQPPQRQAPRVQRPQTQAPQAPTPVAKAPVTKDPQARKVLVIGDFVA